MLLKAILLINSKLFFSKQTEELLASNILDGDIFQGLTNYYQVPSFDATFFVLIPIAL